MPTTVKQTYIQRDQVHLRTRVEAFHQSCTVERNKQISHRCNVQLNYRKEYGFQLLFCVLLNFIFKQNRTNQIVIGN